MSIARRRVRGIVVVAMLVGLPVGFVYFASERALGERFEAPRAIGDPCATSPPDMAEATALARGRTLVRTVGQCTFCHGEDLGGEVVGDDPMIGRVAATNLTRAGFAREATFCDWDRAIRRGVRADGRSLLLMPSRYYAKLGADDVAAIARYIGSLPPVDRDIAPRRIGWLSRVVTAIGQADDVFSARGHEIADPRPTSREVELVDAGLCRVCHKADLSGGLHPLALPGEPEPPPLVGESAMVGWSKADFARAMRQGRTPDGRTLDRHYMPWPAYADLDDASIATLWNALRGWEERGPPFDIAAPPP